MNVIVLSDQFPIKNPVQYLDKLAKFISRIPHSQIIIRYLCGEGLAKAVQEKTGAKQNPVQIHRSRINPLVAIVKQSQPDTIIIFIVQAENVRQYAHIVAQGMGHSGHTPESTFYGYLIADDNNSYFIQDLQGPLNS